MGATKFSSVGAALFGAAMFIAPQVEFAAKQGQDLPGQKCDLNKKDGTSKTGQCSTVCKDLDVSDAKDVNTGHRTCKEKARAVATWGLVPIAGNPSVQFLRFNDTGE